MPSKPVTSMLCEPLFMHCLSTSSIGIILLLNVLMMKLHQQFLHQLNINININVVTVGRIIDEISNSLYSPFGDSRVQNMYV